MPSFLIPPTIHYTQLFTDCITLKIAEDYLSLLSDYRAVLLQLNWKFRYGPAGKSNPKYYRHVQSELLEIEIYIRDLETKILTLK